MYSLTEWGECHIDLWERQQGLRRLWGTYSSVLAMCMQGFGLIFSVAKIYITYIHNSLEE